MPVAGPETLAGSAICLIGLGRAGIPPRAVLPDAAGLCRRLAAAIRDEAQPGAVGLALWANGALRALAPLSLLAEAGFAPEELDLALPGMTTTEIAWLVSGLLHADVPALRPATIAALRELESRAGPGDAALRPCLRRRSAALAAAPAHCRFQRPGLRVASPGLCRDGAGRSGTPPVGRPRRQRDGGVAGPAWPVVGAAR
ncbi:hypothetical protein [Dankookia sp. P2]|uniref:hypothetical protein n=1 Tax=Dankookia sp. P2 TaxID=3423955 RepID=UPI003D675F0D